LTEEILQKLRLDAQQWFNTVDKAIAKQKELEQAGLADANRSERMFNQRIRRLGFALQRFGIQGTAAFGEIFAAVGLIGVAIGGVLVTVNLLSKALSTMFNIAKQGFTTLIKESIDARKEMELTEAQFTAVFRGNEEAGRAAIDRLKALSLELGQNVLQIGRAFLPMVNSLDQLEQIVKASVALSRFQPEQGILGARIALQEFFAGETRSLQRRFEVDASTIAKMKDALGEEGVAGALSVLDDWLVRTGRSVETFADLFQTSTGRVREFIRQLTEVTGRPIVDDLNEQFQGFFDLLEERQGVLERLAAGLGLVIGQVAGIAGEEVEGFFETQLTDEQITKILEAAEAVAEVIARIITRIGGIGETGDILADFLEFIQRISEAAVSLDKKLTFLSDLRGVITSIFDPIGDLAEALSDAFLSAAGASGEFAESMDPLITAAAALNGALKGVFDGVEAFLTAATKGESIIEDLGNAFEAAAEAMGASVTKEVKEAERATRDHVDVTEDQIEAVLDTGAASKWAANQILKLRAAVQDTADSEKKLLEIQEKINKAVNDFNITANLRFQKILTEAQRDRLDAEIDNVRELIDIEREHNDKIEEINQKFTDKTIDAAQDLTDKEQDIIREHGEKVFDLEKEATKARLKQQEDYLDELRRLRMRFDFDAQEAIRRNDAVGLLRIRRRQALEEALLKDRRDDELDDLDDTLAERKEKLDQGLAREIQAARIAAARKIRDLKIDLDRQLEAQDENRRQDIENAAIAEERKRVDLSMALDRELEDYQTWWDERARITTERIDKEIEEWNRLTEAMAVDTVPRTLGELQTEAQELSRLAGNTPAEVMQMILGLGQEELEDYIATMREDLGIPEGVFATPRASELGGLPSELTPEQDEAIRSLIRREDVAPLAAAFEVTSGTGTGVQQPLPFGQPVTPADLEGVTSGLTPEQLALINPSLGFDVEAFKANLDAETQALALAELVKQEELADTTAIAKLLAEQRAVDTQNILDQEVDAFRTASAEEIALLESTIVKLNETAGILGDNAELQETADVIGQAISLLEEEVETQRSAEEEKRSEIEQTSEEVELSARERKLIMQRLLDDEVSEEEKAGLLKILAAEETVKGQTEARDAGRADEIASNALFMTELGTQEEEGLEGLNEIYDYWWRDRHTVTQENITRELQLFQQFIQQRAAMLNTLSQGVVGVLGGGLGGGAPTNTFQQDQLRQLQNLARSLAVQSGLSGQGRAFGGFVQAGVPYVVGERGPELAVFPQNGYIIPNHLMFSPPFAGGGSTSSVDNSRTQQNNFSMLDPDHMTSLMETRLRNMVVDMQTELEGIEG
jgi:hypothetical protein